MIMPEFLTSRFLLTTLIAVAMIIFIAWLAAREQMAKRSRQVLERLGESTYGRLALKRGPDARGFEAAIAPAPEPFVQFSVTYATASALDLPGMVVRTVRGGNELVFLARLPARPVAEILWEAGGIPGQAIGRRNHTSLWVRRHLDIVDADYVVRGANTRAIEHVFVDLQARFHPLLRVIQVQADAEPEVRVVLQASGVNPQEMPALVTSIRGLGRASQRS